MLNNYVISGNYKGKGVSVSLSGKPYISTLFRSIKLTPKTVASYQLLDEQHQKSAVSAVTKAAVGTFLVGDIGIAAAVGAKNKGTYRVMISFRNGKSSLIQVDDITYRAVLESLFPLNDRSFDPGNHTYNSSRTVLLVVWIAFAILSVRSIIGMTSSNNASPAMLILTAIISITMFVEWKNSGSDKIYIGRYSLNKIVFGILGIALAIGSFLLLRK